MWSRNGEKGHLLSKVRKTTIKPEAKASGFPIYNLLKPQWDFFLKKLIDADFVIIVGYSIPDADIEARKVLSAGFQSGKEQSKWIIINPELKDCDNYGRLFGRI
jgi:hypothetical protein